MTVRLGSPRAATVVAPHADDEAIGAGGLIATLRRRGVPVTVIVVSDGAASHPSSNRWPRVRLVAERRRETRRAMARLGVRARDLVFLGLPDGGLTEARECRRAVLRVLAQKRADLLVGPAGDDGHPDHRAVAAAMADSPGKVRRLTYQVWPPQRAGGGRSRRVGRAVAGKRSLIRCYRTQCGAITDDSAGFSIARHEMDVFAHPIERFQEVR